MKIKRMQIQNFRCYYGVHNVEFDTDGKITLIYGLSGAGKSSFLHFINWVLYNNNDFSSGAQKGDKKIDDKPLYNKKACDETSRNSTFEAKGVIEFEHDGMQYKIIRRNIYRKLFNNGDLEDYNVTLLYSNDGNWQAYPDDIASKINEMSPRALSKYFFFHGEKMSDLSEGDEEIKNAIFSMFGIKQYESAIDHLGDKSESGTVINKFYNEMNKNIRLLCNEDPIALLAQVGAYREAKKQCIDKMNNYNELVKKYTNKNNEVLEKIGKIKSSEAFESQIKANQRLIKEYESNIQEYKYKLGRCLYKSVPYLILSQLTGNSVKLLSEEAASQESKKSIVFKNLKKELLKEIIEKNICVCNRELDKETKDYIQSTIDSMPPDSYIYQLKQFAAKSSDYLSKSIEDFSTFDDILGKITNTRNEIYKLTESNRTITNELRKLSDTKDLANEYERNNEEIKKYNALAVEHKAKASRAEILMTQSEKKYEEAIKYNTVKDKYLRKISVLEEIRAKLKQDMGNHVNDTRRVLNESIKNIYEKLSTRLEEKEPVFLKENFGLREESLTGGQTVIDVYSYILGMILALNKLDDRAKENEFPIIIDAPFSHADVIQANRVFTMLPKIASQVIMLSLELDKFKASIDKTRVGKTFLILSNKTQTIARIEPCSIDEMLKLAEEHGKNAKEGIEE